MRRYGRPCGRATSGFTLLELVVTFAILAVAMLLAGRLLVESQLRLAHASRRALDPAASLALEQIRADVRGAAAVPAPDFEWNFDALVLSGHPAGPLRYEKVGTDLIRRVGGGEGAGRDSERIVMRRVRFWRWRLSRDLPLPLVEIELGSRETPVFGAQTGAARRQAVASVTRSRRIAVSPRQAGGKSGW